MSKLHIENKTKRDYNILNKKCILKCVIASSLCLFMFNTHLFAQPSNKFYIDKHSVMYNPLANFIDKKGTILETDFLIEYYNLMDSTTIDKYGIFMFSKAGWPSPSIHLCYKNKKSSKIKIIKKITIKNISRILSKYFIRNKIPTNTQVRCLYSLARFYDDYYFIKDQHNSDRPVY